MAEDTNTTQPTAAKDWPNSPRNPDELDAMLEAGLKSGRSKRSPEEILDAAKKRHGLG